MNMRRLLSLLLAFLMILPTLVACTDNNQTDPKESESESESVSESETETETETETEEVVEDVQLVTDGSTKFTVVYPYDYENLTIVAQGHAEDLVKTVKSLTGAKMKIKDDFIPKNETQDATALEILIGETDYPETEKLLSSIGYGDYAIGIVGKKVVVTAYTTTALAIAMVKFNEILSSAAADGSNITLPGDLYQTATVVPMLNTLPKYQNGTLNTITDSGDGAFVMAVNKADLNAHNAYLASLAENGFALKEERTILNADNNYAVYTDGTYAVTAIHTSYNNASRIIVEPIESNGYFSYENPSNATGSWAPLLIQVGLNKAGTNTQNGMCYIVRLSNGKFLIFDGGHDDTAYRDGQNCQRIVSTLKAYAPNKNNIRIAAWLITHPHTDHIGALQYFCDNYAEDKTITVENVLINFPSDIQAMQDTSSDGLEVKINNYRQKIQKLVKAKGTSVHKCHPGQVYEFADAKLEILYSHDMRAEVPLKESNNLSVVSKLTVAGQTILINGDTHTRSNEVMIKMYGTSLKCDIYQTPHHGFGPNDVDYPLLVDPQYVLVPIGPDKADDIAKNAWIACFINKSTPMFYAKFTTTVFGLPFDGTNYTVKQNGTIQ